MKGAGIGVRALAVASVILLDGCGRDESSPASIKCPPGSKHQGAPPPKNFFEGCYKDVDGYSVRHGPYRMWHSNGTLQLSAEYEDGVAHGWYVSQKDDGTSGAAGMYDHGEPIGEWRTWGPGGVVVNVVDHRGGDHVHFMTWYEHDGTTVDYYECYAGERQIWTERGPGPPTRRCDRDAQ